LDPATFSVAAIAAAITALGKEAVRSAAGVAGKSVWELVKGKLTSESGREVLNDLEKAPDDADNRKAAEAALSKLLKSDPNALAELAQLLEEAGVTSLTAKVRRGCERRSHRRDRGRCRGRCERSTASRAYGTAATDPPRI